MVLLIFFPRKFKVFHFQVLLDYRFLQNHQVNGCQITHVNENKKVKWWESAQLYLNSGLNCIITGGLDACVSSSFSNCTLILSKRSISLSGLFGEKTFDNKHFNQSK